MLSFFLRRASLKEHYILWKYIKLLNYLHTHVYSSQHKTDWVKFNILPWKANQLCATRVGKLLVSTSSSFYTYSHIFLRHHHIRQLLVVALKTIVSFSFFSNLRICKAIVLVPTYLYNEITWKTHTHMHKKRIKSQTYTQNHYHANSKARFIYDEKLK